MLMDYLWLTKCKHNSFIDLATGTLSGAATPKDVTAKTTAKAPVSL